MAGAARFAGFTGFTVFTGIARNAEIGQAAAQVRLCLAAAEEISMSISHLGDQPV
jgi:hypothetical protein